MQECKVIPLVLHNDVAEAQRAIDRSITVLERLLRGTSDAHDRLDMTRALIHLHEARANLS
jgi:hypothetical protein